MPTSHIAVLLAVSGGIDSMTMADMRYRRFGPDFCIAHCNFNLRGSESDSDEALVTKWAGERGIKVFKASFDTLGYAKENGLSIEMAARRLRYDFFASTAVQNGFREVHVAHNSNDNAETLLLNLVRGTGLKGLCGMKRSAPLEMSLGRPCKLSCGKDVMLERPLLEMSREEIEKYALENGVPYHTDRTNSDTSYRRNSIRNEVIPVLQRMNPSLLQTLASDMEHFSQAQSVLDSLYSRQSKRFIDSQGNIIVDALAGISYWEYFLFRALSERGVSAGSIESIESLVRKNDKSSFSGRIFDEGKVVTSRNSIRFVNVSPAASLVVERVSRDSLTSLARPLGEVCCDDSSLPEVKLRTWREGDRIRPLGFKKGSALLSDIFTDRHIPLDIRKNLQLVVSSEDDSLVLAVPEIGLVDERIKVRQTTSAVCLLKIVRS